MVGGSWQLAVVGSWQLATGGWWRVVVVGGGWWWLAAVGGWRLVVGGGWQWLAVSPLAGGGSWWLVVGVGGPLGRSLRAVLSKKKIWSLKDRSGRRPRGTCLGRARVPSPTPGTPTWARSWTSMRTTSTSSASCPPPPPPPPPSLPPVPTQHRGGSPSAQPAAGHPPAQIPGAARSSGVT